MDIRKQDQGVWWSLSSKTSNVRFLPSGQLHMTSGNSSVNTVQLHARTRADAKAEVHMEQTPYYPERSPHHPNSSTHITKTVKMCCWGYEDVYLEDPPPPKAEKKDTHEYILMSSDLPKPAEAPVAAPVSHVRFKFPNMNLAPARVQRSHLLTLRTTTI